MSFLKIPTFLIICLSICFLGCVGSQDDFRELDETDNVTNTAPPEEHDHHHEEGPHGGHILEFGDYHAEIAFADGVVSLYPLSDDIKTAVPLEGTTVVLNLVVGEETKEIPLGADPQEGDAEGAASKFSSAAGSLPDSVKDIEDIVGSVVVTKGDDKLTAKIEHDHDHHHHDH